VIDGEGNVQIKNASGTWPIDKRPGLKTILDLIEEDKIKLVIVEFVDRLFRDEDRIDSNIFIKTCKEHDCFVYITSKKMTYNFANSQMCEMFRMEVAFAAAYIQHHVKDVMIRRRDQAVEKGQYGGGYVPMGFIVCKDENSKYNKHLLSYKVNSDIINEIAIKILKMGMPAFCQYAEKNPIFFPDFEDKDQVGHRSAKKVKGGYTITTRTGLIDLVLNPANIGIMEYGDDIWVEELAILADIYPNGSHEEVLQALPQRSWRSITDRASIKKIKRRYCRWQIQVDITMSWSDYMYLSTNNNIVFGKWTYTP